LSVFGFVRPHLLSEGGVIGKLRNMCRWCKSLIMNLKNLIIGAFDLIGIDNLRLSDLLCRRCLTVVLLKSCLTLSSSILSKY